MIAFRSNVMDTNYELQFTDEQASLYSIIEGPVYHDCCEHPAGSYVCSYTICNNKGIQKYDLYLFPNSYLGLEVCIRCGNEPKKYISPGSIMDFVFSAGCHWREAPEYVRGSEILRNFYKVTRLDFKASEYFKHEPQ